MKPSQTKMRPKRRRMAYTLVELMMALSIFSFSATAISSLMFATYETNTHVQGMTAATSAAEIALRRIIEVTRSGIALESDSTTPLYVKTPPDSSDSSYIFIYYIRTNTDTGNPALFEKILSYSSVGGALTQIEDVAIVDNIRTFTVTQNNTPNSANPQPNNYTVNFVLNATPVPISRTVKITTRNISS